MEVLGQLKPAFRPDGTVTFRTGDAEDLVEKLGMALRRPPRPGMVPDAGAWLLPRYRRLAGVSRDELHSAVGGVGAGAESL